MNRFLVNLLMTPDRLLSAVLRKIGLLLFYLFRPEVEADVARREKQAQDMLRNAGAINDEALRLLSEDCEVRRDIQRMLDELAERQRCQIGNITGAAGDQPKDP